MVKYLNVNFNKLKISLKIYAKGKLKKSETI